MAPSVTNDRIKILKKGIKRFFNKSKTKKDSEDGWNFDSAPDYFFKDKSDKDTVQQPEGRPRKKEKSNSDETDASRAEKEEGKEEANQGKNSENPMDFSEKPGGMVVNMGPNGKFHFGSKTTVNTTYYVNLTSNKSKQKKSTKEVPDTVKAVLQSKEMLGIDHTQFLSEHFGNDYRPIGLKLELSNAQIDKIESDCGDDNQQIALKIMEKWKEMKGEEATIGRLSTTLWKSKIQRAMEAVEKLSENIDGFN